jgi:hypothetical protein
MAPWTCRTFLVCVALAGTAFCLPAAAPQNAAPYAAVDITPPGFTWSLANGISAGDIVGQADRNVVIWHAATGIQDITPDGYSRPDAVAISGRSQVGVGYSSPYADAIPHALLWHGSRAVVDLNPPGYSRSIGTGVSGDQQVGFGSALLLPSGALVDSVGGTLAGLSGSLGRLLLREAFAYAGPHALLWSGTALSAVDLSPPGIPWSPATAVAGGRQVGWGAGPATNYYPRALLWSGSAESVVNLHALLPPGAFD